MVQLNVCMYKLYFPTVKTWSQKVEIMVSAVQKNLVFKYVHKM